MRRVVTSVVLLAALTVPSADASFPGRPGLIAYNQETSGRGVAIFVAQGQRSEPRRLTPRDGFTFDPAFSPDGRFIAYAYGRQDGSYNLWVMRADGSGKRRLTTLSGDELQPAFSADGRWIAFTQSVGREPDEIMRVRLSGGAPQPLVRYAGGLAPRQPVYSANGRWLAWVVADGTAILVGRPDGSSARVVARRAFEPDFTPNSRRIIFRGERRCEPGGPYRDVLLAVSPTGRNHRVVEKACNRNLSEPVVSPAGGWVAATGYRLFPTRVEYHLTMVRMPGTHAPLPLGGAPHLSPSSVEPSASWQPLPRR